jgi:hypothetical protein
MLLLKALSLFVTLLVGRANAATNLTWTGYCPFDIELASYNDPKSLDLTYTPTSTPINPVMFGGKACLVEIHFSTPDERGDVYLEEIEYKSNKEMSIETKVAWNGAFGPVSERYPLLPALGYKIFHKSQLEVKVARKSPSRGVLSCSTADLIYLMFHFSDASSTPTPRDMLLI